MGNLANYFRQNRYQPRYHIGDRVFGHWNRIPFIGTVGNDGQVNEIEGPKVSIHLDLPIRHKDQIHNIIFVKPRDIRKVKVYEDFT